MAWKNGEFSFKSATLEIILHQAARWYDIDMVFQILQYSDVNIRMEEGRRLVIKQSFWKQPWYKPEDVKLLTDKSRIMQLWALFPHMQGDLIGILLSGCLYWLLRKRGKRFYKHLSSKKRMVLLLEVLVCLLIFLVIRDITDAYTNNKQGNQPCHRHLGNRKM